MSDAVSVSSELLEVWKIIKHTLLKIEKELRIAPELSLGWETGKDTIEVVLTSN